MVSRSRAETVGLFMVDKPAGPTSHDCVQRLRRAYRERRVGHTGTLDPFATGLLLICMGRATRLARFFSELPKTYEARIRFGFATDTYDATGKATTDRVPVSWDESLLKETLAAFEGRQLQTPPPFSAKKIGGQRAHRLARAGKAATPDPVWVDVSSIRLLEWSGEEAVVEVSVSSGTYIRSLAHDIGKRLETGAHLSALRRTEIGGFSVEHASAYDAFLASRGGIASLPACLAR